MALVSAGVSVTITNDSYYIPATSPTVPLFFIATRADKKQADGISTALGALEHSIVRTITSLGQSISTYGVPKFLTDNIGAQLHGDARNEYGLFALNQALTILSRAYVVRANVDLSDNSITTFTSDVPVSGTNIGLGGTFSTPLVNQVGVVAEQWSLVATTSGTASIGKLGIIVPGTLYTDGSYLAVPLTGGTGSGATANITVLGGIVTDVTLVNRGIGYTNADNLSALALDIGGTGSGFAIPVTGLVASQFTVTGFSSLAQANATIGTPYNNGLVSFTITNGSVPFVTGDSFTFNVTSALVNNPLGANDAAKRASIVTALRAEINSNQDVRAELYEYNLILCPGYYETTGDLINLNVAINEEAFVIADTPMTKSPEDTAIWSGTIERENSQSAAYYYPHGLAANLDGVEVFCAASGIGLKTIAYSDSVSEVWMPPAGLRRGIVTGVTNIGYVTGTLGTATTFVSTPLNQGQRDVLYQTAGATGRINIIPFLPGKGIVVFGQKTSASLASALDRINVMRLLTMMKRDMRKSSMAFLFELNNRLTQDSLKQMLDNYLNDILLRNGLYDYIVICDSSVNTPTRIDRNELWAAIAIKPEKAVEFIHIPIRVVATGASLV